MSPTGRAPALALVAALAAPPQAVAETFSLVAGSSLFASRAALVPAAPQPADATAMTASASPPRGASLFAGRDGASLFARRPERPAAAEAVLQGSVRAALHAPGATAGPAARIRHLIAKAEADRAGYDAVQHGARLRPPRPPTRMTITEIYAWIKATSGQPHAIGRYQFIPATLRRLVRTLGLPPDTVFSPEIQDRLADLLLEEAGLGEVAAGRIGRTRFMNNLAQIWAGLPTSSGKSHYHGFAGNRATMTWRQFDAEMAMIFPG